MQVTIDWEVAREELTKEELQILNIIVGKIQDGYADSCRCSDDHVTDEEEDNEPTIDYTPPKYEVFYTNGGEEKMNTLVNAIDDQDAVLRWYRDNKLDGELVLNNGTKDWTYNGCPIHLERLR